jgi:multidrug efflux pump subunit AcrB
MSLPVEEYPEIAPPTVQVSATYTGANGNRIKQCSDSARGRNKWC